MVIFGSIASSTVVWGLADITMIAMALLNLYAIVRLSKIVVLALRDYREKRKKGIPLTFKGQDIGVESDTTCWD
jgi:AGCS family alanine or glycine:cation symporter